MLIPAAALVLSQFWLQELHQLESRSDLSADSESRHCWTRNRMAGIQLDPFEIIWHQM